MKPIDELIHPNIFDDMQRVIVKSIAKEYARQACAEQRRICLKSFDSHNFHDIMKSVYNAPQPKLK
jgi:hypothetical protein